MPAKTVAPRGVQGGVGLNPPCGGACFRIDFAVPGGGVRRNKAGTRSNTIAFCTPHCKYGRVSSPCSQHVCNYCMTNRVICKLRRFLSKTHSADLSLNLNFMQVTEKWSEHELT
jgi:hypothetical protein